MCIGMCTCLYMFFKPLKMYIETSGAANLWNVLNLLFNAAFKEYELQ